MGLVERKPHPTDGRQVNIELTAKGAAVRNSASDAKRTWLAQAIAQLDERGTGDALRGRRDYQAPGGAMSSRGASSISHAWRALRHRNFQLFFSGQSISLIGTWMTRLATSWLVYRLTHSALLLGVVSFAGQIAAFVLAPLAGVWVERVEPPQAAGVDASRRRHSVARPGRAHAGARHHPRRDYRAGRFARLDQRLRHAGAAVVPGAHGGGPRRPRQRDRD